MGLELALTQSLSQRPNLFESLCSCCLSCLVGQWTPYWAVGLCTGGSWQSDGDAARSIQCEMRHSGGIAIASLNVKACRFVCARVKDEPGNRSSA